MSHNRRTDFVIRVANVYRRFPQHCKKATTRLVMPVSVLLVRMEEHGSHRMDFHEILYLNIFRKSVEKIKV